MALGQFDTTMVIFTLTDQPCGIRNVFYPVKLLKSVLSLIDGFTGC